MYIYVYIKTTSRHDVLIQTEKVFSFGFIGKSDSYREYAGIERHEQQENRYPTNVLRLSRTQPNNNARKRNRRYSHGDI